MVVMKQMETLTQQQKIAVCHQTKVKLEAEPQDLKLA